MIFKEIFMNYPVTILLIVPETGKIIAANNKAVEVYGYSLEELTSMNIMNLNKLKTEKIKNYMNQAKNNDENYFNFPHITKTGKIILMEVQSLPTKINNQDVLVSFIYPCKSKEYLNNSVMKFIHDAKILTKVKYNFFSKISHNMRTPMNAVINYAKFGMEESHDEKDTKYFKQIYTSGNYLLNLLNESLDIEEDNSNNLKKEIINLTEIIIDILTIIAPKIESKKINFITNLDTLKNNNYHIFCNKIKISQMIINSLNNTIKYIENNQSINFNINIIHLKKNSDFLEYTITSRDKHGKSTTSTSKIPIELIEKKKDLETKENFQIKNIGNIKNYTNKLKILVCEDNEINFKIIEKILKSKGYDVDIAENGLIGLNKIKSKNYDFVIMDIMMPVMNGLEATKEIRKFNKHIPIIGLSANTYKKDIEKSLAVGINKYLSKPIDSTKLFQTLKHLTNKKTNNPTFS